MPRSHRAGELTASTVFWEWWGEAVALPSAPRMSLGGECQRGPLQGS